MTRRDAVKALGACSAAVTVPGALVLSARAAVVPAETMTAARKPFVAGDRITAASVNARFDALADAVAALEARLA